MNEDFVTFELAKKLKERGFKEKCIAYYWEKINEHTPSFVVEDNMPEDGVCILDLISEHNKAEWSPFIDAPTISQVLKWLREEKKIFVSVDISEGGWFYVLSPIIIEDGKEISQESEVDDKEFSDYNSAAIAGIEYCLDNLI